MQRKEYILPNGKKAVFEYDVCGIGKITLECMDELMAMIADRPSAVYEYLKCKIGDIVDSETEFDAWFNRMVWHVEECNRLADRPQGEWIGEADGYADGEFVYDTWYCSNCDYVVDDDEPPTWNYCPNCGAKMSNASNASNTLETLETLEKGETE